MALDPGIDEFIMEELRRRMAEGERESVPHMDTMMDPAEPREGNIDSLRRRFGPDEINEDELDSLIRRNMPGRRY